MMVREIGSSSIIDRKPFGTNSFHSIPFADEFFENFSKPGNRVRVDVNSMFGTCQERNLNDIEVLCEHLNNVTKNKRVSIWFVSIQQQ